MSFIETISSTAATGETKALYEQAEAGSGYLANYMLLFGYRPEVHQAWEALIASIRSNMTLRRYELITLAAARKLTGSYCMLAHGEMLLNSGEVNADQLIAIANDYHDADLAPEEVAMMEFAEKVIVNSTSITQADVDRLKGFGFSDAEILDITLATTARSFFSKTLDALNAQPDDKFLKLDPDLRNALAVGRPFGETETV